MTLKSVLVEIVLVETVLVGDPLYFVKRARILYAHHYSISKDIKESFETIFFNKVYWFLYPQALNSTTGFTIRESSTQIPPLVI